MEKNLSDLGLDKGKIFIENRNNADKYFAYCLLISIGVCILMWIANAVGFFVVHKASMNVAMGLGIVFFAIPPVVVLLLHKRGEYIKYLSMVCFLVGLTTLSSMLTIHLILAWACPLILSLHYYSPKYTRILLVVTLVAMLIALYCGVFVGVWDRNIMQSDKATNSFYERIEYVKNRPAQGDNIMKRIFNFYYLPRALIICVLYAVCETLSRRTHRLLERQMEIIYDKERIGAELNVARQIQSSMLPCIFPAFPEIKEIDIYATMNPAKEVGGDFYDFFMVDERHLAIVMADVSGKGVPAALFMVIGKTLIKDHTKPDRNLGEVFAEVNKLLCESNSEGLFITAFEGVLDLVTGQFVFVNAGHELPFIRRADGDFVPYKTRSGFVLAGMEGTRYTQGETTLSAGDMIFQYTDGVTEATDADNQLYGMERLEKALNANKDKLPQGVLQAIKLDIDTFVGEAPQFDDITMLCLQFKDYMKEVE